MSMQRRSFIRGTLAGSAVGVAVSAGLLTPRSVFAEWPSKAFEAKTVDDALMGAYETTAAAESGDITVKAPDIAENGAVVPVTVETSLSGVSTMSIIAEKNPSPLVAKYVLGPNTEGYISMRIKMGKTSNVTAVVEAGGKLYKASKEVKVTIGGCGG